MKLSLNSSTIKTTPLLDKIRVAGEAGYAGIELWAVELYEHVGRGGEISDVEKALADHGLSVPCMIAVRNWGENIRMGIQARARRGASSHGAGGSVRCTVCCLHSAVGAAGHRPST